jgi:hypothetical protein
MTDLPLLLIVKSTTQVHHWAITVARLDLEKLQVFREKLVVSYLKLDLLDGHIKRKGKCQFHSLISFSRSELFTYRFKGEV